MSLSQTGWSTLNGEHSMYEGQVNVKQSYIPFLENYYFTTAYFSLYI